ncbi:hypothetical protein IPF37_06195 [bacterium]|nr:MAG: hypothetical protein IPF37_06195 [bacterium]
MKKKYRFFLAITAFSMKFLAAGPLFIADGPESALYQDGELGIEYRFIEEAKMCSQIGIFSLLEIPTSDEEQELARSSCVQLFMPVSLQKVWSEETKNRTMYGGVDTDINQGLITKINGFCEWLFQQRLARSLKPRVRVSYRITPYLDTPSPWGIGIESGAAFKKDWQVFYALGVWEESFYCYVELLRTW